MKQASNCLASSSEKTRPNVSWEAIPLANGSCWRNQSSFISLHSTTKVQLSAPLMTAQMAASSNSSS